MENKYLQLLKEKCPPESLKRLTDIDNPYLMEFVGKYIELCKPDTVFVRGDDDKDADYIRRRAIERQEEKPLKMEGHTIHFDGYNDQARDKANTKFLLPPNNRLGDNINKTDRQEGLKEVHGLLEGMMQGRECYVCFYSLGPSNSPFSIAAVQITDSPYVGHSEDILYRRGYEQFKKLTDKAGFFKFVHSEGELEGGVSKNIDKRRVYIDLQENIVYSTNTQYGGNTIGLKKLAMRLAIQKAAREDWLCEHMFVMGIKDDEGKTSYFTGAYPSACGKTSTAMLEGETIIGDDIAYLRKMNKKVRTVNVERGMFGIIRDVNSEADPLIWQALNTPGEVIFSNILMTEDGSVYWLGADGECPEKGINYSGEWFQGKTDASGSEITPSHKNARYTIRLGKLANLDPKAEAPEGVEVAGCIYGGRDSDTSAPVVQAFDWNHGILTMAATLESETTAATLGQEGVRTFNPMSNLDFLSIPIGEYIENNLKFVEGLDKVPAIFAVNYFLKDKEGKYLNGIHDKHIWLKWMALRVNNKVEAIKTPVGYIPLYEDLKRLFKETLNKDYTPEDYNEQFKLRVPENLAKIERIISIYKEQVKNPPEALFKELKEQQERLSLAKEQQGDYILPEKMKK